MPGSLLADQVQFVVAILLVATAAAFITQRLRIPYTVTLVLLGLGAHGIGVLPELHLTPGLVLLVFLPALLFEAAWNLDILTLRSVWKPVTLLATAGVFVAAAGIALAVHLGSGMPWPEALLLGTILSATDPVSVVALFRSIKVPHGLATTLEGESLFNDGTSVALFQVLLAAIATGHLDAPNVGGQFVWVSTGGLGLGLAIGFVACLCLGWLEDPLTGVMLTTVVAYGAFLIALRLGVSPVLAVVAAGLLMGNAARGRIGLDSHDKARWPLGLGALRPIANQICLAIDSFWDYAAFAANSVLFLLVGLEFAPGPVMAHFAPFLWALVGMQAARLVGVVMLGALGPARPRPREWPVFFWGALRGALSLGMALSLPQTLADRASIIAIVYACVLFTLVIQGLTVPWIVKRTRWV